MTSFEELLERDGRLVYRIKGVSMNPMLRQNRDLVIIEPAPSALRKYDVALYRRGDSYVLHRVIGVIEGGYLIRGDNTYVTERVPDSEVIGVLTGFQRGGVSHDVAEPGYRLYSRLWTAIYPLRKAAVYFRRAAVKCARKMGILPLLKRILRKER